MIFTYPLSSYVSSYSTNMTRLRFINMVVWIFFISGKTIHQRMNHLGLCSFYISKLFAISSLDFTVDDIFSFRARRLVSTHLRNLFWVCASWVINPFDLLGDSSGTGSVPIITGCCLSSASIKKPTTCALDHE